MSNKTINSYESKVRLLAEYLVNELNIDSAEEVKEIHLKSYIRYLQERGKYTVVANENSIKTNNPQNRANYNKKIIILVIVAIIIVGVLAIYFISNNKNKKEDSVLVNNVKKI